MSKLLLNNPAETWRAKTPLVLQIIETYYDAETNRVTWTKAFNEHPAWRKELGLTSPEAMQRFSVWIAGERKAGRIAQLGESQPVQLPPSRRTTMPKVEEPKHETTSVGKSHVNFCPQCGTNILSVRLLVPKLEGCPVCLIPFAPIDAAMSSLAPEATATATAH